MDFESVEAPESHRAPVTPPGLNIRSLVLRTSDAIAALGFWGAAMIARYEGWCIVLAVARCALGLTWYARRPLWYDELFTFYIARLRHLHQMFQAIPADGNPPLYYLLARISMHAVGRMEIAVRLPSILAMTAAALAVYFFVRRHRAPVFALLAFFLLASSEMASYGGEGRPYALLLGFTGLTLVSWQVAAGDGRRAPRSLGLIGIAAGIACAIATHHYGAVHVGVPLLFGESVRIVKRRRLDIPLYCAAAAGLCMLVFTVPFAHASYRVMLDYVKQSSLFWAKPNFGQLLAYRSMAPLWFFPAFAVLVAATSGASISREKPQPSKEEGVPAYEVAAAIGLTSILPVMVALTWFTTGYFVARYAISAAMGVAILVGLAAPACARTTRQAMAVSALCIVLLGASYFVSAASRIISRVSPADHPAASSSTANSGSILDSAPGNDPIVVASALTYMPEWWYASPQLRARLHYLADLTFAVHQPDFLPELSLVVNQAYVPSKVDNYQQFINAHHRFLVYSVGMPALEWTLGRLRSAHWSLTPIRSQAGATLYLAEAPG